MRIEGRYQFAAPPERVWEVLMDPDRLGDWVTIHERFEDAPAELTRGSQMTQRLKVAGQRFSVRWTVTEDDPPARVKWEGSGPAGTNAKVVYDLEERDGGTRFSYLNEYELPGGAAGRIAGRAVSAAAGREVERSLERRKQLLEG